MKNMNNKTKLLETMSKQKQNKLEKLSSAKQSDVKRSNASSEIKDHEKEWQEEKEKCKLKIKRLDEAVKAKSKQLIEHMQRDRN